ncbi:MAG: hypothetical protein RIQ79_957 [Verrucomicrobiota bacterium]
MNDSSGAGTRAHDQNLLTALRETETAYGRLFAQTPLPMWVRDSATLRFLDVNQAAIDAYGYSHEEFLTMNSDQIRPPEEIERFHQIISRPGAAETESYSGVSIHLRKDATRMTVEVWSHPVTFQGRPARMVIARDITDQLRTEAELRLSRERFQLLASAASDALWDLDFATNTVWRSDSFYSLFGHSPGTFGSSLTDWADAIHPADRERVLASFARARIERLENWRESYRFRRGDGSHAQVMDRGRVVNDAAGHPHRMVGGMSDVTEQNRLQEQRVRAQRLESIGTLAGGIAHDLNNMLSPVVIATDLLRMQELSPASLRYLELIETGAQRSASLVRQVLALARDVETHRVPIDIAAFIQEIARFTSQTFPTHVHVKVELPAGLWVIHGDPAQLNQVLLNLALNARDAMPDGGRLTLAARNEIVAPENTAPPAPFTILTVADTGRGIAPEHLDRVLEPFFTTKQIGNGTGLGLSTAHAIVKEHNGFITVQSKPGHGTRFEVHLPATPGEGAVT